MDRRASHLAVLFGAILIGVIAVPTATASHSGVEAPEITVTVEHLGNANATIKFTVTIDKPPKYSNIRLYLPEKVNVTHVDGFEKADTNLDSPVYRVRTSAPATLAFTIDANNMPKGRLVYDLVDGTRENAVITTPRLSVSWETNGRIYTVEPFKEQQSKNINVGSPNGVIGEYMMLLGNHSVYTTEADETTVKVVVPESAEFKNNPGAVLGTLSRFYSAHNIGGSEEVIFLISPYQEVNAFAFFGGEAVVAQGETNRLRDENIWVHESVHIKQDFRATENTQWTYEGFAQYYALKYAYKTGNVSEQELQAYFDAENSGVLEEPDTWSGGTNYERGAKLVAALDMKIRNETNGKKTVDAVFRKLNSDNRPLTESDLKRAVNDVSGVTLSGWMEKRTSTREPISIDGWFEAHTVNRTDTDEEPKTPAQTPTISPREGEVPCSNATMTPECITTLCPKYCL